MADWALGTSGVDDALAEDEASVGAGDADGYDTVLDDEASNLSAGEEQLLTITRTFLARPNVLILVVESGRIVEQGAHR